MADFDPCECVYSQEAAMRRLLSLLRNSQGYCTDGECTSDAPGPSAVDAGGLFAGGQTMLLIMTIWVAAALALFLLRPRSLRDSGDQKPSGSGASGPADHDDDAAGPSSRGLPSSSGRGRGEDDDAPPLD